MTVQAIQSPATAGQYFSELRANFNGPTLADARAWSRLNRMERKCLARLAGYDNTPAPNQVRGDLAIIAGRDWSQLSDKQRRKLKTAAGRLGPILAGFEGVHVARKERG